MKRIFLAFFILMFFQLSISAQNKAQIDCNTIFMGIDHITYKRLFANKYVKDTLFICREVSNKTNKDEYTGKYLIGESATIEFFSEKPKGKLGDKLGDVGVELKTHSVNELEKLIQLAKKLKIAVDTANVYYQAPDTTISWYNSISIANKNFGFSTLTYQPQYLKYLGFTDAEIGLPMSFKQFNTKLSGGKAYPRLFSSIKSISISVNDSDLAKVKDFCRLNGFVIGKNKFTNGYFEVFYIVNNRLKVLKMNSIDINLLTNQPKRSIVISDVFKIKVFGRQATLLFK